MARLLPLFPLQLVVFPGEDLNLHIFEPRYRQLIGECRDKGIHFGIPAFIKQEVQKVGTEVELVSIEKVYPSGEMDIRTRGLSLFRIEEFYDKMPKKLYAGARIEKMDIIDDGDILQNEKILELVSKLFQLLNIDKEIPTNLQEFRIYDIAHHVGLSVEQEYQLLSILNEKGRQDFVQKHLEKLIPVVEEMEKLRQKIQMNGHFKNLIPPKF